MSKLLDLIYKSITYIGLFPKKLLKSIYDLIKKLVLKIKKSIKEASPAKKTARLKICLCFAVVIVIGVGVYTGISSSTKVSAVEIKAGNSSVGYVSDKEDAELAKNTALEVLGSKYEKKITTLQGKTDAYNLKAPKEISSHIIDVFKEDLIPVTEIYVNGKFLAAGENTDETREAVSLEYKKAQKEFPDSTVSFLDAVTFKPTYYTKDNENFLPPDKLKAKLQSSKSVLKIRRTECEERVVPSNFDTVEIQTNQLFKGDKRVRRTGQNGADYQVNLITFIDNKKTYAEPLLNVSIRKPVSQIVERGIRAETLTLGTHTVIQTIGAFCWPVVDLYTVTSPYGPRSMGFHRGIDISGNNAAGSLVVAGADGRVVEAGWNTGGFGNFVKIDHGNGVETLYAHMLDNSITVHPGEYVKKGQIIGQVGDTGYSFGAHLHFEVRINGNRIDPAPYLGLQ